MNRLDTVTSADETMNELAALATAAVARVVYRRGASDETGHQRETTP
jgi:hypothetical protein